MTNDDGKAKEIFLKFGGDYFHMGREGVLESYRAFTIPKDTEKIWARECEGNLLDSFREYGVVDSQVIILTNLIVHFKSYAGLLGFISAIEQKASSMDTFTRLRLCEEITEVVSSLKTKEHSEVVVLNRAMRLVFDLLQFAQKEPITVHSYYRTVPHLPETLEGDNLRHRIIKLTTGMLSSLVSRGEREKNSGAD